MMTMLMILIGKENSWATNVYIVNIYEQGKYELRWCLF